MRRAYPDRVAIKAAGVTRLRADSSNGNATPGDIPGAPTRGRTPVYPQPQFPQQPIEQATKQGGIPAWAWIVLAAAVILAGAIVATALILSNNGSGSTNSSGKSVLGPTTTTATVPVEDTVEPEPDPEPFSTDDFNLTIKTLSKECFEDYGCHVEFRVVPTYIGSDLSYEDRTVEVTYQVTGLKGKQTNTFELTNGEYDQYEVEGFGETPSSSTRLKAKVTSVTE